jgi:hypothetical protein
MSASINSMDCDKQSTTADHDRSFNLDEIEQLMSNDLSPADTETRTVKSPPNRVETQSARQSATSTHPVQNVRLSLEQSLSTQQDDTPNSDTNVLKVKTSNVPGPVGLLPVLVSEECLPKM